MEFKANFNKSLASCSSFSVENPCRTPKENEFSTISNHLYQNVPSFGNFSTSGTLSNPSIGNESQFYKNNYPSESQSGNKSFMHLGSVGSNGVVHSEIPNYSQRILSQDSNSLSFDGESYTESKNPVNENPGISDQGLNKSVSHQKAKPHTKGKKGRSNPTSKGLWTPEEDSQLTELVHEFGEKRWARVSYKLKGRVGKQCRERWLNHLKPGIKKEKITEEEELVIVAGHQQHGSKWATIAKRLPGRSENAVKNHFNAAKRRLKNREAPKTYLEEYIMSISSESSNNDLSDSPDVVHASSSLEDKEQVTSDDGTDVGLTCAVTHMVDARYDSEHNNQMLPTDDVDIVSPYFPEKVVVSGNYVDEDFSVKDHNSAPKFGLGVGFNVEDDDLFLEASTGWK